MASGLGVLFYKQKTAYDMLISDWSSDVCPSDLVAAAAHGIGDFLGLVLGGGGTGTLLQRLDHVVLHLGQRADGGWRDPGRLDHGEAAAGEVDDLRQIGRATCRERVCQNV